MGVQAGPCQALHTHDFSPLSKGEATEGSAESTGNIILAAIWILRADPCLPKFYEMIITLLQIHESPLLLTCVYIHRKRK